MTQPSSFSKRTFVHFYSSDLPCLLISLALFLGGIWLLSLKISGWGLLFGLIATPLGLIFAIYTLDDVARNTLAPQPFQPTHCQICNKVTFALPEEEDVICGRCREKISQNISVENSLKSQSKL